MELLDDLKCIMVVLVGDGGDLLEVPVEVLVLDDFEF